MKYEDRENVKILLVNCIKQNCKNCGYYITGCTGAAERALGLINELERDVLRANAAREGIK